MEKKSCDKCIRWICAILFSAFAFCWLFFFQRDLLTALNRDLFSGNAGMVSWMSHHHYVTSVILASVALLLAIPGRLFLRFRKGLYACNYLISAAFLGFITGYDGESFFGQTYVQWIVVSAFIIVLFLVCKIVESVPKSNYNDRPRTLAGNLLLLSLLFCLTGYIGNTEENLHRRLSMERLYLEGDYEHLLDLGRYEEESEPAIDLLRAKAMLNLPSNPGGSGIGDRLFGYSICSPTVLADSLKNMNNTQAYLSACLLIHDTESFRDSIRLEDYETLPKYYMQALVIDNDSIAQVRFPQQFADEKKTYDSFCEALGPQEFQSRQYQANATFIKFHESYFWFYTFSR